MIPILPGISGYGTNTEAGSGPNRVGGDIIRVTTLDDHSNPGSLRYALEQSGPRIVIFEVSGYIDLTMGGQINITEPYLTIAGQTAPSPGISLKGNGLSIKTHDVLVQHLAVRVGDDPTGEAGTQRDGIEIIDQPEDSGTCYNVVIDHCSVSWATDENMSVIQGARDITITNTIISEGLNSPLQPNHSMGLLYDGSIHNVSAIKNLFAHNDWRNPRGQENQDTIFVNNYIYNRGQQASTYGGDSGKIIFSHIGNVYKKGPSTASDWVLQINVGEVPANPSGFQEFEVYLHDNLSDDIVNTETIDPWSFVVIEDDKITEASIRFESPPVPLPENMTIMSSYSTRSTILDTVGARPVDRDPTDLRVVQSVRGLTGAILVSQDDIGGWPTLAENSRKLTTPNDPWQITPEGYNQVELWLQGYSLEVEGSGDEESVSIIVEDGTGIATANSYASLIEADTYFADRGITSWTGTNDVKNQALIKATDYVETRWAQRFKGSLEFPNTPQALSFPRINLRDKQGTLVKGVPLNLKKALFEYALRALSTTLFLTPTIDDTGVKLTKKKTKVGPIEKELEYASNSVSSIKPLAAADLLIKPYITSGGSNFR